MEDLDEINEKIKRIKEVERVRAWGKRNPEKVKEKNRIWNAEYRNEYQRAYRKKHK